jgi:hypothetical protein
MIAIILFIKNGIKNTMTALAIALRKFFLALGPSSGFIKALEKVIEPPIIKKMGTTI